MSLIDDLRATPAELRALRTTFETHAQPADEWPEHRPGVRALAEALHRDGDARAAALILVAALEDLRRFFVTPDGDDDGGWHRSESKSWEAWAYCQALRRILDVSDVRAAWRPEVLAAVAALGNDAADLTEWIDAESLAPLSPATRIAERLRAAPNVDVATLEAIVAEEAGEYVEGEAEVLMTRIVTLRAVGERIAAEGHWQAASVVAMAGLHLQSTAERDEELVISAERDAVFEEQIRPLEAVLVSAVERGGASLRDEVQRMAGESGVAADRRVRALLRPSSDAADPARKQAEYARIRARRDSASNEDDRLTLDSELVFEFGDHLSDEEYLAICRRWNWTERAVQRLLRRDRTDEAFALAQCSLEGERLATSHELCGLGEQFMGAQRFDLAEQLLRLRADEDPEVAERFARSLSAQRKPEAEAACLGWFKLRPTLKTYQAIASAISDETWKHVRDRLLRYLDTARLPTTLVDIAVHEQDVAAIERLLPSLRGVALDHARIRVAPLRSRLSAQSTKLLEPSDRRTTTEAIEPPPPRAAAEPPTHVSHAKFGKGRVLRVEGTGEQCKYVVEFDQHGQKTLLARFLCAVSP